MAGQRVAAFAWELQQLFSKHNATSDAAGFFTSPISLYIALGLAMAGAGANSNTQQELCNLLHQPLHQDKSHLLGLVKPEVASDAGVADLLQSISQLSAALLHQHRADSKSVVPAVTKGAELILANGIWTQKVQIQADYAAQMHKLFQAAVRQAENADVINQWAAQVTQGFITQAIPPGSKFDVVLTNAVYFKGMWEYSFEEEATKKKSFALEGGATTQVDMMSHTFSCTPPKSPPVEYIQTSNYEAVHLPYKGGTTSAVIVLPDAESAKHGVAAAAAKLDIGELLNFDRYTPVGDTELTVELPRFEVKTEGVSFKEVLSELGVKDAFKPPTHYGGANFSKMSEKPLYISDVLQSVCIIVDEKGTQAAAMTPLLEWEDGTDSYPPLVKIAFDRPFLFMVVHDATRTPLFVGTVLKPS